MDYISTSPVLTSILTCLSCRELAACSAVSRKFFDVIERNRGMMSKWRIHLSIDSVSNVFLIVGSSTQDDSCKWTIVIYEKKISVHDTVGVLGYLPGIANVIARKRATCENYKRNSYNEEIEFEASGKSEEFSEVMRIIRDRFKLVNLKLVGIPLTSSQMNSVIPLVRGIRMNVLEFRSSLDNVAMQLYRASDVATVKMWILELNKRVIIRAADVTSKQLNEDNFFQLDTARSNIEVVGDELLLNVIKRIMQTDDLITATDDLHNVLAEPTLKEDMALVMPSFAVVVRQYNNTPPLLATDSDIEVHFRSQILQRIADVLWWIIKEARTRRALPVNDASA